jgi:hypothetical protein
MRFDPMPTDTSTALDKARALQTLLREIAALPEHGEGSPVSFAAELMSDVCGYLEPDEPERPPLRLVGR